MQHDPYVAVIFSSRRTDDDDAGYLAETARMEALASEQPGYVGIESARGSSGFGITVSYWVDDAAAIAWKQQTEHLAAQRRGRTTWYDTYSVRVATVEREYHHARPIVHLAMPADWEAAIASGGYPMSTRGVTVEQEGFVHCSFRHQMLGVAQRFYADTDELVILHLDRAALADDLVVEPAAEGVAEHFPHLYRELPLDAVTATTVWRRAADGGWHQPDGL